ncbi:MAG: hypothetical protein JWM10_5288 [Myxococcaceae bacterium]|nr:hypothetical protein [Myxococcaceae bacterium]
MAASREENLTLVSAALGRSRRAMVILAVVVFGLGGLCSLALDEHPTTGAIVIVALVAGFFAMLGVLLLWVGFVKNSPQRSPLVVALRERPDDVVWIYLQDVAVDVSGIAAPVQDANVIANLRDGSTVAITVQKSQAPALLAALAALAPGAATGFSEARQAQFKGSPGSLAGTGPT